MNPTFFQGVRIDHFEKQYKVYTGAFANKSQIDEGGKIILPSSTLGHLASLNIVWPIMLKLTNTQHGTSTHCGVLEFSAEEGLAYIPFWMQEHLRLSPGQLIKVENASLPKGSYVKIRPQQKAFIENISDPKAVLEKKMSNFACLTVGDTIIIRHLDMDYSLDILEVKAASAPEANAISIIETDVEVDFERPLDMPPTPEAVRKEQLEKHFERAMAGSSASEGPVIGGSGVSRKRRYRSKKEKEQEKEQREKELAEEKDRFVAFHGSGRRLDGKQVKTVGASPPTTSFINRAAATPSPIAPSPVSSSPQEKPTYNGNGTVLGGDGSKDKPEVDEQSKFVPFGGKGRSLK